MLIKALWAFQFHTGSIKSLTHRTLAITVHLGFNSILVRLKEPHIGYIYLPEARFQFHTGSIKSIHYASYSGITGMFQFHTGSIKSFLNVEGLTVIERFQFHTGSIKRFTIQSQLGKTIECFNSILVRLKVKKTSLSKSMLGRVSIPYWFD